MWINCCTLKHRDRRVLFSPRDMILALCLATAALALPGCGLGVIAGVVGVAAAGGGGGGGGGGVDTPAVVKLQSVGPEGLVIPDPGSDLESYYEGCVNIIYRLTDPESDRVSVDIGYQVRGENE